MEDIFEMHVVEAKINPQAVLDYYHHSDLSGKSREVRDVQMMAKQHLAAMGWRFHYIVKKCGKKELRYCPPDGKKKYISLRTACKGYLDRESQLGKISDDGLGSQFGERSGNGLGSQDDGLGKISDDGLGSQLGKISDDGLGSQFGERSGKVLESQFGETTDENVTDNVLESEKTDDVLESQCGKTADSVLESQSGKTNVLNGEVLREANVDVSKSKKRRLSFVDVCGERMLVCMKGKKDVVGEDDALLQDTLSEQENFAEFYNDLHGDVNSKNMNVGTELGGNSSSDLFLPGGKDSKLANRVKRRKIGRRGGSGGKLAWLIKIQVIKPLTKVYYRNRKDGSVMGEGWATSEGIDCSHCRDVFTLTDFEAHVGSTYHRPAEHIFVEDGRSLMQIEQEMGAVDKQVKGIKKKAKGSNNGSVSGTMQQKRHDDFCLVCRDTGELILCDQCTSSFHPHCLGLSEVPASEFWYCASCCCKICGQKCPKDDSEPSNECDQCEQQFHVKCLGECCVAEPERKKWFCGEKCKVISSGLGKLLGKTFLVGDNDLSWTVLKNENNVIDVETTRKLNHALAVMHECFKSVKEPWNGRDVAEDVIFSRQSEVKRLDYRGFYTVILEKKAEVVTVANVRIFGDKVAEVPLIATRFKYRRLGMCKTLMDVLEEKLANLGVEKLVLPAIPSVVDTWTSPSFGFSEMTPNDRSKLINYTLLSFPDNVTCQKLLVGSG